MSKELDNNAVAEKWSGLSDKQKALLALRMKKQGAEQPAQSLKITRLERTGEDRFTASYSQKRFWFLDQWHTNKAAYNTHLVSKLVGRLDLNALKQTFDAIVNRHEILQMVYRNREHEVECCRHSNPVVTIGEKSVKAFTRKQLEEKIEDFVHEEVHNPFDLANDLPIRVTLLSVSKKEHYLIIVVHHIVSDMWSLRVMNKEIECFYNAFARGQQPELPELPVQYMDYAVWQRNLLEGKVTERQTQYWKEQLAGAPPCLPLMTDFPRPDVQTYNGKVHKFIIPEGMAGKIQTLASEEAITPFVFSLTAFAILLNRYTQADDIVIGSPVAGRTHKEVEDLMGLFINTLAIRVRLEGNPRIRELLQTVKKTVMGAVANQELPFEKLVEELQIERDLSYSPVFQAMFNFQSIEKTALQLAELEVSPFLRSNNTTKFDLNLAVKYIEGEMTCFLTYNTDLFLPETIQRMAGHYMEIISSMAESFNLKAHEIETLTPLEKQTLLSEWSFSEYINHPDVPYVHKLFEEQVQKSPAAIAAACQGRSYTYEELNQRANKLAHYLSAKGVGPEKRVALFAERSLETVVGILGILKAGGAYVPIDPLFPVERIRYILEDASIDIVVAEAHLAVSLGDTATAEWVYLDADWPAIAEQSSDNMAVPLQPSNLIYIIYTSGSTGKPKGVAVEHGNFLNYYFGVMQRLDVEPGLKYAIASTFAADLATINVWAALNTGGQLHILTYDQSVDSQQYAKYFREHGIDVIKMVPSHFKALRERANLRDIIPNKRLILAGEPSYWDMIDDIRAAKPETEIQIHYGPTETTVSMLTYTVTEKRPAQHTSVLPLGRPLPNVSIYVLDDKMQLAPIGVPGELFIGGPGVARAYLGRPELNVEKFVPNPFDEENGGRLYRTGDIVRYLENGIIEFLSRVDEQVKIRGFRIELGEIQSSLLEYPGIKDAFVTVHEDAGGEKKIAAYYVPGGSQPVNLSALRNSLKEKLPGYMVPAVFMELDKMPLNANGKVERSALPAPNAVEAASESDYEAPRDELEARMAAVWSEVLNIERIGINDDFFSLGGDSFKAVQVVRGIDHALSIIDLFKYPTIGELSAIVSQGSTDSGDVLHRLSRGGNAAEEIAIVCVPFAGGSAISYQPLADALADHYALYAVQVPGHDFSNKDEVLEPLEEVARRCVQEIKDKVAAPSIVVYGHCLGGALAIEIARLLEQENMNLAGVVMGGNFPVSQLPGKLFKLWNKLLPRDRRISNRAYMDMLRSLGGFSETLSGEERDFIIRSLRHDRRESERYYSDRYADANHAKLKAPLLCIVGERDRTTEFYEEQYKDWEFFSSHVDLDLIPNAGHYFFKHQSHDVADCIENGLEAWQQQKANEEKQGNQESQKQNNRETAASPEVLPNLRTLFIFVFGQFISMMGSSLTGFAMGLWVYSHSGAIMDFAATLVFHRLPGILMLPFAGVLADKKDRRHILIWSNVCSAVVTIMIALFFYSNSLETWHIYVAVAALSIANAFQRPAYLAAVAQIAPKRYLGQANGIVQLATSSSEVLAPLLGGVLVMTLELPGILLIDFLSFVFAISTLLFIRFPNSLFRKIEEPFWTQMAGGWNFIRKRKSFVALILFFMISNLMLGMANVLITPLVLTFGSTVVLGMVTSAIGIGGLAGGVAMGLWGGTRRRAEGMIGFSLLIGLSYIVMGLTPITWLVMAGVFVYGVSLSMTNAHWQTLIQSKVRAELLARVFSINQLFALPTIPLGYYIGGLLSDKIFKPLFVDHPELVKSLGWIVGTGPTRGIGLLFILIGLFMAAWSFLGLKYNPLRYMDDILPDAIPGPLFIRDKDRIQQEEDRELERINKQLASKNVFSRGKSYDI
ncbi:amino acid adenylation domain-containing protein [Paenibacillus sp. FSL H8-0537]|uniref:non-ribosomal peptide synthetase/MFS transporter n=1 Tax=Paenibacillus sp. FSL H8-0537 TaxID=2921399 RepID=UPI0031019D59